MVTSIHASKPRSEQKVAGAGHWFSISRAWVVTKSSTSSPVWLEAWSGGPHHRLWPLASAPTRTKGVS